MQDCRWKESLAAFFNSLLQATLHPVLFLELERAHWFRQIAKATDRSFNLTDSFEVRQRVQTRGEMLCQIDMMLDRFGITAPAHEFKSHPKFQRIEAASAHLSVAEEDVLD